MKGKILVTGGTGYIGSHTVVELVNAGFEVLIVDNLENSFPEVLDGIEKITNKRPQFFQLDLRSTTDVAKFFFENTDINAIVHFAAYKAVGESVEKPLQYYYNNINALLNVLENIKRPADMKFVFSSSCAVYGEPPVLPVNEETGTGKPTSPYGNTKKVCEEILNDFCKVSNMSCVSLRYFNPIGAHSSAFIGELPIGRPNNLVPYITQTAAGIREKITVYGNDYPTPDGTCIRDYIHVTDVAKAHVKAVEYLLNNNNNEEPLTFLNLGTGSGNSVLEIIQAFEKSAGVPLKYEIGPRRLGDVAAVYADTKLANEKLGWKAQETIDSMMLSAWKWQLKIPELYPNLQQ